jgi:hypothetical protein
MGHIAVYDQTFHDNNGLPRYPVIVLANSDKPSHNPLYPPIATQVSKGKLGKEACRRLYNKLHATAVSNKDIVKLLVSKVWTTMWSYSKNYRLYKTPLIYSLSNPNPTPVFKNLTRKRYQKWP